MTRSISALLLMILSIFSYRAHTLDFSGEIDASDFDQQEIVFLSQTAEKLLESCTQETPRKKMPRVKYKAIAFEYRGDNIQIQLFSNSAQSLSLAVYVGSGGSVAQHQQCSTVFSMQLISVIESKSEAERLKNKQIKLSSYEPNSLGWSYDDNDVAKGYMDFKVSLKYPLFNSGQYSERAYILNPFITFSGRFSQYIGSIDSSPVIAKRFNPQILFRHWLGSDNHYIDLGYAHESNGQSIGSEQAYLQLREDYAASGQNPDFAKNYISRGWDYLALDWKYSHRRYNNRLALYVNAKHFLTNGLLQTDIEEYNEWENDPAGKPRDEVDGLSSLLRYRWEDHTVLRLSKLALIYTTGIHSPFKHHTARMEATFDLGVPLMLWFSHGYNSDLVDYYRQVSSAGVALELKTF